MRSLHIVPVLWILCISLLNAQGLCESRGFDWRHNQHNYLYSGSIQDEGADWNSARDYCRQRCMDLVSINSEPEWRVIRKHLKQLNVSAIWSSGHLCTKQVSNRCFTEPDLQPRIVYAWFWAGSGHRIPPTNSTAPGWSYSPWGKYGSLKEAESRQPDNAEQLSNLGRGEEEACLALLYSSLESAYVWEDYSCYPKLQWLCEDSEDLLLEAGINKPIIFG
ncbi:uncharacterized protein LOC111707766 isoform X2 [Eurytemora carolleeae]|uniref:uncharacterized protein LOC111707766 isoform X2 n=1 Tax=Eurytemora carolleeae TaxID=1294199 RepID=UPI000C75AA2F|nr:uncharacterized protein LOC111707766 isoform X2 [Eurytemora carolleeae]|eukprot:XP_023336673.1 uncharacterized protein LOC111707766 isoform X2 [Eurytemora affinis]